MTGTTSQPRPEVRETLEKLRGLPGLFSFQEGVPKAQSVTQNGSAPRLGVRAGGIVEWLVARKGAGAFTAALQILAQSSCARGAWALVDPAREIYVPALCGWGIDPSRTLIVRPATLQETCWAIEQCLRSPRVSATWAWVDGRIPARVSRRWQLSAEAGGGVGLFFRPVLVRRDPVWADLRLLVTPQAGGRGETRRVQIEVLYSRGGLGGSASAWEIDHAAGIVRLVPKVADPATAERAERA